MQKTSFLLFDKKDNAFTLIEMLVSLFLVSMISAIMYFSVSTSIRNLINLKEKSRDAYEWYLCDTTLRNWISTISIPFWANDFVFEGDETILRSNYLDGKKDMQTVHLPQNVKITKIDFLTDTDKKPFGVHIIYSISDKEYELKEVFSSFPVGVYGL